MDIGYKSSVFDQEPQTNPTQGMEVSMPVTGKGRRHFSELQHSRDIEGLDWLIQAMKDPQAVPWTEKMRLRPQDTTELLNKVANGPQWRRKMALIILGRMRGIRIRTLCSIFDTSLDTVGRYWRRFNDMGIESLSRRHPGPAPKAEDETIKAAVFSVIHSPPSEHNMELGDLRVLIRTN